MSLRTHSQYWIWEPYATLSGRKNDVAAQNGLISSITTFLTPTSKAGHPYPEKKFRSGDCEGGGHGVSQNGIPTQLRRSQNAAIHIIFIRVCGAKFLGMVWGHPTPHVPLDLIPPIWEKSDRNVKNPSKFS